jgi:hypothetical protein
MDMCMYQIMKEFLTVECVFWSILSTGILWFFEFISTTNVFNIKLLLFTQIFFFCDKCVFITLYLEFRGYLSCIAQKSNSTHWWPIIFFFPVKIVKRLEYWVWSNSTNSTTILYVCIGRMDSSIFFLMINVLCINIKNIKVQENWITMLCLLELLMLFSRELILSFKKDRRCNLLLVCLSFVLYYPIFINENF